MENKQSISKFRLTVLWTIICLSIFLFIVPNSAQAKKVFIPEAGGAITGHMAPFQTKSRDVVGRNEILRGDGVNDWMFAISLRAEGTIKSITIRNTNGEFSVWDTKPNNGFWLLGVTTYDKRVLNKSDGSVYFNVSGRTDLYLLAADNGSSLRQGKTSYKVIIEFVDGRVLERNVGSASDQIPGTVRDIRWLTDRVWQFGRGDGSVIAGKIRLRFGGKIEGYSHYNETRWGLEGNTLVFYDGGGKPTCRFTTARTVDGRIVLSGPLIPNPQISHVLREVASQQPQSAQPPGISGAQATGATPPGIDWNNKPWLDWRVQNCVRRYLIERVLRMENEKQLRNKKPLFTHIDEWGRLLNQYITPHGKVDGNWDNPTHYVWYAYNLDAARGNYQYTVEEWIKRFCEEVRQAAAGPVAVAPGVPPVPGGVPGAPPGIDWNNKPWLDWRVQNCVRRYLIERVLRMENEKQLRNKKPLFTHIDEWGRLLNQYITPHGKVDGNWDNPTHYVWYAYNLDAARGNYQYTVEEWIKRFCEEVRQAAAGPVAGITTPAPPSPPPPTGDDQGSPFDENYQGFIQTQTIRDETRTQQIQEQMSIDSMFAASQGGSAGPFTQEGLTDQLTQMQPSSESAASTSTQTSQEQEGTTSTPGRKCEAVGLNSGSWRQLQNNRGPLSQGQGGLVLHGDEWTNGKLKNGKFDGNGVESNKIFDLKNGGDVYMTFKVDDGGKYLAIFPKVFSEAGYKLLTTDHVWAGSVVVPNNTNLYAHININTNGKYKTTVCKGNYDDQGGSSISEYNGTLKKKTGRVRIRFVDNYAGKKAYLVILKAEVCIPPKTAVPAAPPEPTKPPTQIGCDTTTKQGGNKPETFIVELGQKSGTFIFKYNMYNVPDRMLVEYEGRKLFDTGCVGNKQGAGRGVGSKSITYSGASTKVTVKVLPSCEGGNTKWTFTANCPTKPPTTPKFKCKSNKDCWDHHKECNWYCKKKTGECIPCRKNEHGKRDGTEACCSGPKRYPNCFARD